ncbi:MAG TPA: serine hydrolase domain-containing protein [Planctomycetota bacterium]|nr:serine hydrolase domain-containing protein [Planctomycetota bacterium]
MLRTLFVVIATGACLVAQRQAPGTIVEGEVGLDLNYAVTSKAPDFWGAVLVAVEGRILLAKGYGLADRQKVPIGPQSLFDLGGASQQVTLLAALRLVADKKLRLEESVGKYVEDWPADRADVTVASLVRHTSGLPPEAKWEGSAARLSRTALQTIGRTALLGRPGEVERYSGVNASLLALVMEEATHQHFDRLLTDRVTRPFGMGTAVLCNGRPDQKLVTYRRSPANERGEPATQFDLNWAHRGARGLLASVLDVHAMLSGLAGGRLLPAELLDQLWSPLASGGAYAVLPVPLNGETYVNVRGQCGGYRAHWFVHRSSQSWAIVLTDDQGPVDELEGALLAQIGKLRAAASPVASGEPAPSKTEPGASAAPEPAALGTGPPWPQAAADRFVGTFVLPRGGGTLSIEREGKALRLAAAGLQASARLAEGRWPPPNEARLRQAEDLGLSLLGRLLADEPAVDAEGFGDAAAGAAARQLVRTWQAEHGGAARASYIGTRLEGAGESWFRLVGKDAQLVLRAPWHDERRWQRCVAATEPAPFAVWLEFVQPDCAVARSATGGLFSFTIEGEGDTRRLVFEDQSFGGDGLLECELAPPGR